MPLVQGQHFGNLCAEMREITVVKGSSLRVTSNPVSLPFQLGGLSSEKAP